MPRLRRLPAGRRSLRHDKADETHAELWHVSTMAARKRRDPMSGTLMDDEPEWITRLMGNPETRRILNRMESHLGCVSCRGKLVDGRCYTCDPPV